MQPVQVQIQACQTAPHSDPPWCLEYDLIVQQYRHKIKDFCIECGKFLLMPTSLDIKQMQVIVQAKLVYSNGQPLRLPISCIEVLTHIAGVHSQKIKCTASRFDGQIRVECCLPMSQVKAHRDGIRQGLKSIQKQIIKVQQVLVMVGVVKKFSRKGYCIRREQLKMHQSISKIITSNTPEDNLVHKCTQQSNLSPQIYVQQVLQNPQHKQKQVLLRQGPLFQVHMKHSIVKKQSGELLYMPLAWKTPFDPNSRHKDILCQKIRKQVQFISSLSPSKHALNYYYSEKTPHSMYIQPASKVLKQQMDSHRLSMSQLIDVGEQLIDAVKILHQHDIIHRDLKPDNILFERQTLKVIDFAESALSSWPPEQNVYLGYTHPYSPFECSLGKEEGFNKKSIDLWSIAVILYEMVFGVIPFFYSKMVIGKQIIDIWRNSDKGPDSFTLYPQCRGYGGLRKIQYLVSLVCIRGLQIKPEDRLGLSCYKMIIGEIKSFYKRMLQIQ